MPTTYGMTSFDRSMSETFVILETARTKVFRRFPHGSAGRGIRGSLYQLMHNGLNMNE